jgi:NADH:ubiquinone oxidoreductase subunit K
MIELQTLVALSALLFLMGLLGVFVHRHMIAVWIGIQLMFSGGNLALIAFDRHWARVSGSEYGSDGNVMTFVVLAVCVAQTIAFAALLISSSRNRDSLNIEGIDLLKW